MTSTRNKHLREQKSGAYREDKLTDEFCEFVSEQVLPLATLRGYKQDEKRRVLTNVVHNLILLELAGRVVADSRNNATNGLRIGVWDAVVEAGLANKCTGSESSRMVTRYRPTGKLMKLRVHWKLAMLTGTSAATPDDRKLVRLHTGKRDVVGDKLPEDRQKQPINLGAHIAKRAQSEENGSTDRGIENGLDHWRGVSDVIAQINAMNLNHGWAAKRTHDDRTESVWQPSVSLCQIHSGHLHSAGRLYTLTALSGQLLPKAERSRMLIDGQPTAELDFSGMHPRMLYHRARQNPSGDIYKPSSVLPDAYQSAKPGQRKTLRSFVKRATNICLNATSRSAANSSVANVVRKSDAPAYLATAINAVGGAVGVVDQIVSAHPVIADQFFTCVGMELMDIDGKIMLRIMYDLATNNIPAMPIHDSICCRATDVDLVRKLMADTYMMFMNWQPEISRVY